MGRRKKTENTGAPAEKSKRQQPFALSTRARAEALQLISACAQGEDVSPAAEMFVAANREAVQQAIDYLDLEAGKRADAERKAALKAKRAELRAALKALDA